MTEHAPEQLARRIAPVPADSEALRGAPPLNVFRTLARNEPLARAFSALGGHLLRKGELPAREREIVVLRAGWRCGSEYEFGQHTVIGRQAGLTDDEVARLAQDGSSGWSDDDAVLVEAVDDLCADDVVSQPVWDRAALRWTEEQLLELLVLAGFYRLVSGLLNSAGVALEPGTPGWPAGAAVRRSAPRDAQEQA